jgi:hypothetical protein
LAEQIPTSDLTIVAGAGHVSLLRSCGAKILSGLHAGR